MYPVPRREDLVEITVCMLESINGTGWEVEVEITLVESKMPSASNTRRLAGFRGVVRDGDKGRLCFRGVLLPVKVTGARN